MKSDVLEQNTPAENSEKAVSQNYNSNNKLSSLSPSPLHAADRTCHASACQAVGPRIDAARVDPAAFTFKHNILPRSRPSCASA